MKNTRLASCLGSLCLLAGLWLGATAVAAAGPVTPADFQHRSVPANGQEIHVVMGGKGPAILLIHGWPETWYEWRKVMPLLSRDFTVIVPDMRGFGDSSLAATGYDKKTLAMDMYETVRALGFQSAVVVGHDWGGPVAYALAAQHPEMVEKLVLIEGAPFGPWMPTIEPFWFFHFLRVPGYAEKVLAGREAEFLSYFYHNDEFHVVAHAIDPAAQAVYNAAFSRPGRMQPSFELYRTIEQDVKDNAAFSKTPLKMPVLAIAAEAGAGEFALNAAKHVAPNRVPLLLRKTGHFIPEERPEVLAQSIADFISGKAIPPEWNP